MRTLSGYVGILCLISAGCGSDEASGMRPTSDAGASGGVGNGGNGGSAGAGASDGGSAGNAGSDAGGGPGSGRFVVVGKDIVAPDGKRFFPFGANLAAPVKKSGKVERSYVFDHGGTADGHSAEALAWGWNTVRLTVVCHRPGFATATELADGVDEVVKEYTAKNIVVMIECHDDTGKTLPLSSAEMVSVEAFWDLVMARYKDNPWVWFNPLNEATSDSSSASLSYWTSTHQHFVAKRDALGAENVMVIDIPGFAQGVAAVADTNLADSVGKGKCNIAFAWHPYGGASNSEPKTKYPGWLDAIQARGLALLFGEYGYRIDNQPPYGAITYQTSVDATDFVLQQGKSHGVGALVWHGTGDSGGSIAFSLSSDTSAAGAAFFNHADGKGLSSLGQKVWDAGHAKPDLGTFTGKLSDSGCASQQ